MILIIWISGILLFFIMFWGIKLFCAHKCILSDDTLQEKLKTANQYEIAFLKGGENLVAELAFYHLLKSGYLEKKESKEPGGNTYLYRAILSKDASVLNEIERMVLEEFKNFARPISSGYCLIVKLPRLEKCLLRLFNLDMFFPSRKAVRILKTIYIIYAWSASLIYLLGDTSHSIWTRILFSVVINHSAHSIWRMILVRDDYAYGKLLSDSGGKYIKLFEATIFPLPDFKSDKLYRETLEVNPCSV